MNLADIRAEFPILSTERNGKPLVYLDSAATAQKPLKVIERINQYMREENGTVRRGIYHLSSLSTDLFEQAREIVRGFINAESAQEIVFTKNCTEAINLVVRSWGGANLSEGDEIILSTMEHHANIVPWQIIAKEKGAEIKVLSITESGELDLEQLPTLITPQTKLISITHVSNALGTINNIKKIIEIAHQNNVLVLIDGCQAAPHIPINVQDLDADFYAFSGHKVYGPTGIGILYAKGSILESMPPYQGGGDMIDRVTFEETTYAEPPVRFEAGTPPIIEAIGLKAAIEFLSEIGHSTLISHEQELLKAGTEMLSNISGLRIIGTAPEKVGVISFIIEGVHPYDLATLIDQEDNIAMRTGHHCAQPLMDYYNVSGTARISFGMYNTLPEIEILGESIQKALKILL